MGVPFSRLLDGSAISAMEARRSVRTYSNRQISPEVREQILRTLRELRGPFEGAVRCELIEKKDTALKEDVKLGTYGVIINASSFLAAVVAQNSGRQTMEQLGYVFEQAVLYLTSVGLGTCWLAGTFRRSAFARALHLDDNQIIPVVIPFGYTSRIRGPVDMLFKPTLTRRRLPWQSLFFDETPENPLERSVAGPYAVPLDMVRLAPSASNKQPWRVLRQGQSFLFFLAGSPAYRRRYEFDIQKIDMGIAMLHFETAASEVGLSGHWKNPPLSQSQIRGWEHIMTWIPD